MGPPRPTDPIPSSTLLQMWSTWTLGKICPNPKLLLGPCPTYKLEGHHNVDCPVRQRVGKSPTFLPSQEPTMVTWIPGSPLSDLLRFATGEDWKGSEFVASTKGALSELLVSLEFSGKMLSFLFDTDRSLQTGLILCLTNSFSHAGFFVCLFGISTCPVAFLGKDLLQKLNFSYTFTFCTTLVLQLQYSIPNPPNPPTTYNLPLPVSLLETLVWEISNPTCAIHAPQFQYALKILLSSFTSHSIQ